MKFARNPSNDQAVLDLLAATAPLSAPRWLLIDPALLDGQRLKQLFAMTGWPTHNTLAGSPMEAFGDKAPQLVSLPSDTEQAHVAVRRLMALNPVASAVSLVTSRAALSELQQLFGYLAQARIDGDLQVHCRFADTRVLPHLLAALAAPQLARVSKEILQWVWTDHLGRAARWSAKAAATDAAALDLAPQLELDARQFSTMLDASEPDTVFSLLVDNTPELVPAQNLGDFRDELSTILKQATTRRLTTPNDRWQFVVLALSCKHAFDDHPGLQTTWQAVAKGATLVDQMKLWGDELWAQLEGRQHASA
jgi:Domain of unknown function (DUF4123)